MGLVTGWLSTAVQFPTSRPDGHRREVTYRLGAIQVLDRQTALAPCTVYQLTAIGPYPVGTGEHANSLVGDPSQLIQAAACCAY
jgi:hypothetical protein